MGPQHGLQHSPQHHRPDTGLPLDAVLAAGLRAGDEAVFRLVLDAWSPSMLRLARSFVATAQAAEEAVQEAWLAVIQGVDRFEGRSSLKTWTFRILVNIAKKHGAKESRTLPFSSLLPEDEGPSVDPSRFRPDTDLYPGHWNPGQKPQPWSLPETAALQAEARAVLGAALAALPDRHRVVVTLRDVEGYSSEEVSSMLGISAGNQRVILHRARGAVRARLESYFADSIPRRAPLDTDTQRASKPPELVSKASESEAAATASPRPARRRSPAARSR